MTLRLQQQFNQSYESHMDEPQNPIGKWAGRIKNYRSTTREHKIESVINTRWITRCGRQMERVTHDGTLTVFQYPTVGNQCAVCG